MIILVEKHSSTLIDARNCTWKIFTKYADVTSSIIISPIHVYITSFHAFVVSA